VSSWVPQRDLKSGASQFTSACNRLEGNDDLNTQEFIEVWVIGATPYVLFGCVQVMMNYLYVVVIELSQLYRKRKSLGLFSGSRVTHGVICGRRHRVVACAMVDYGSLRLNSCCKVFIVVKVVL
jgi:hypothetical protein